MYKSEFDLDLNQTTRNRFGLELNLKVEALKPNLQTVAQF